MTKLISGKDVFHFMDTIGLPLEIINICLRKRGAYFDVIEFVNAALASKNFTYETIKQRLLEAMSAKDAVKREFAEMLDRKYIL